MLDGIEFLKKIQEIKLSPFYFFLGDEDYLIDVAIDRIVERLKAEKRVFWGDETTPSAILQELGKLDLFGSRSPVVEVVRQVYRLKNWKTGFKAHESIRNGVIILVADSVEELSKRWFKSNYPLRPSRIEKNLKKTLPSQTVYVHFPTLDKDGPLFKQWLKRELDKRKLKVNRMVWQEFINLLPNRMRPILNELDKIALYFGENGGEIDKSVMMNFLAPYGEAEGLAITNMLVDGNTTALVSTIETLLNDGVYAGQIMATTASSFVKMLSLKNGEQRVRLPSFLVRKYRKFVSKKRVYELMAVFDRFVEADTAMKTYPQDSPTLLKTMFLEVLIHLSSGKSKRRKKR